MVTICGAGEPLAWAGGVGDEGAPKGAAGWTGNGEPEAKPSSLGIEEFAGGPGAVGFSGTSTGGGWIVGWNMFALVTLLWVPEANGCWLKLCGLMDCPGWGLAATAAGCG